MQNLAYTRPSLANFPLLQELSDRQAAVHPERPYLRYTEDNDPETVVQISHLEVNRASHRFATIVSKLPGYDPSAREPVAVIALSDVLVYTAMFLGTLRAGMVPFFMNPRNSVAAVVNLINKTRCSRILTTPTLSKLTTEVLQQLQVTNPDLQIRVDLVPDLELVYPYLGAETAEHPFQPFQTITKEAGLEDVYLYMHSSGSTGLPKVVPQTRRAFSGWCDRAHLDVWASYPSLCVAVMPMPMFHVMGMCSVIVAGLNSGAILGIYPPVVRSASDLPYLPTPTNFIEHAKRAGCNAMMSTPSFVHEWAQHPGHLDILKEMHFVMYAGGPIVPKIGDYCVEQGVPLVCIYGSTEAGVFSDGSIFCHQIPGGWQYQRFDPKLHVRWIDQNDGTNEAQVLVTETQVPSVFNLEDVKGYATSDLFRSHPSDPDVRMPVGRIDSVIVLATSEKVVPEPLEGIIGAHPSIQGVVMFGRARNTVGVLVEPRPGKLAGYSPQSIAEFKETIWPTIMEANAQVAAFGRIFKERILVSSPGKPLPRAAKGTVMAKAALAAYEREIDELYEAAGSNTEALGNTDATRPCPQSFADRDKLEAWLVTEVEDLTSKYGIDPGMDLFYQGFDSLHASVLRNRIVQALSTQSSAQVPLEIVYNNPTLRGLAGVLAQLASAASPDDRAASHTGLAVYAVNDAIDKYSQALSSPAPHYTPTQSTSFSVLLTGSTGNLGAHLLAYLVKHHSTVRIYAHNRRSSSGLSLIERQRMSLKAHGLDTTVLDDDKLVLLEGDLAEAQLGLSPERYTELLENVNVVIHNAWKSNFNLTLQSFAPFMDGSVNLINFSLRAKHTSLLRFTFTSSVSSVKSWMSKAGPVPEEPISDPSVAIGGGYGESKYVVERVLQKSGLNSSTLRITQLTGGRATGLWSSEEWLPALLRSSIALGLLPSSEGLVSWVPLPATAQIILDDALGDVFSGTNVFNLEHPKAISWSTIVGYLNEALVHEKVIQAPLRLIPLHEWITQLQSVSLGASRQQFEDMPVLKLLPFFLSLSSQASGSDIAMFGGQAPLRVDKLVARSKTMASMNSLTAEDASQWVRYWVKIGFLKATSTEEQTAVGN